MSDWSLVHDDRDGTPAALRESLCTIGNGYIVTRGAAAERSADSDDYPGTYLAGGYDRLTSDLAGRVTESEELVNWPNWLSLTFRPVGGSWLDTTTWTILEQRHSLDLQRGVFVRRLRVRDPDGRVTTLRSRRLVHMERAHLAAIEWEVTPENWSGPLVVRSALDATVTNAGAGRVAGSSGRHLVPVLAECAGDGIIRLLVESAQSHVRMAQAARTMVFAGGHTQRVERHHVELPGYVAEELLFATGPGRTVCVEKTVAIFTSRDYATSEPLAEAGELAARAPRFSELLRTHALAWKRLWHRCDIAIVETPHPSAGAGRAIDAHAGTPADGTHDAPVAADDAPNLRAALRLRLFHLLQTVSPHCVELDAGVPVHGWQGEGSRGHVSWDELFLFPLVDLRVPEMARALLMYRFRRLDAARMVAAAEGARGARFPWRSGSNGREEARRERLDARSGRWRPDRSHLQAHVNSAVAYDVWHYYQATADHEFLSFYGAEIILEIARYWSSRATLDDDDGRYHIRGVVGPDEYHDEYHDRHDGQRHDEHHDVDPAGSTDGDRDGVPDGVPDGGGVDDNAYTNVMAAWVLRCADRVLDRLPADRRSELRDQLEVTDDELERWREIGRLLAVHFHDGVISQFDGYGRLPEQQEAGGAAGVSGAEYDRPVRYRQSSRPDVLMLPYLFTEPELIELLAHLGYDVDHATIARTTRYYLDRTAPHDSPMTAVVHARVLARTDSASSWSLLAGALAADGGPGGDRQGIHIGAMAAAVDVVQGGYLGVTLDDEAIWLDPRLPESLAELRTKLRHRGQWLEVCATAGELCVTARDSGARNAVRVGVAGTVHELHPGETLRVATHGQSARPPEQPAREQLAIGVPH